MMFNKLKKLLRYIKSNTPLMFSIYINKKNYINHLCEGKQNEYT